jgi:hypothetical protein
MLAGHVSPPPVNPLDRVVRSENSILRAVITNSAGLETEEYSNIALSDLPSSDPAKQEYSCGTAFLSDAKTVR